MTTSNSAARAILALERVGETTFRAHAHHPNHAGGVYGGDLLAQAVRAAELSAPERTPHSLHAQFCRPGDASAPIDYQVSAPHEGASFSSRRVSATQSGGVILEALVSLQIPEAGYTHASPWSERPPNPAEAPLLQEIAETYADRLPRLHRNIINRFAGFLDTRLVDAEDFLLRKSAPRGKLWIRPAHPAALADSHYACLAFVSDYLMPAAAYLPHTISIFDPDLIAVSLNHAIWFHAAPQPGAWMLHEFESHWAAHGRGLSAGRLYSEDGELLATTTQESLLRPRRPDRVVGPP